ncbi:hypothetical protein ACLOJK_007796 [Asimina triloba]
MNRNEHGDDSTPQARIPKSYVPITPMPSIAVCKGPQHKEKNVKEIDLDHRTNIRASPIPRPRAVLSSPDNDGMIGNRNKLLRERQSVLKTRNSGPGTVAQGKTILKKDSPTATPTKRIPKESDGKTQRTPKESDGKAQRTPKASDGKTQRTPKASDGKTQLTEKLAKEPIVSQQKLLLKKGKPITGGT